MPRTNNFDLLRLLAAAAVLYGHAFPLSGVTDVVLLGNSIQALAVKIFFVISGYLVSESWVRDPRIVAFFLRRGLRIFPGLIVVVLVTAFVLGPLMTTVAQGEYFADPRTLSYLENVLLYPVYYLPGLFAGNPYPAAVNGSLWSLPVEFAMYLATPALLFARQRHAWPARLLVVTVVLCAVSLYLLRISPLKTGLIVYGTDLPSALDAAPYFLLGATYRLYRLDRWAEPQGALLLVFLLCWIPPGTVWSELALFIALPYVMIGFANAEHTWFGSIGRIGDLSYGTYLCGFPIQQAVAQLAGTSGHPLRNFLISLPPTLGIAALSWHLIEKRCLALKPRRSAIAFGIPAPEAQPSIGQAMP